MNDLEQKHKAIDGDAKNQLDLSETDIHESHQFNESSECTDQAENHLSQEKSEATENFSEPMDYSPTTLTTNKSKDDVQTGKQNSFLKIFSSDPVLTKTSVNEGTSVVVDDINKITNFFLVGVSPSRNETSSRKIEDQREIPNDIPTLVISNDVSNLTDSDGISKDRVQSTILNNGVNSALSENMNRVWVNLSVKNDVSQMEGLLNQFHGKFSDQIRSMEHMMSVTMGLHSKMQENLKLWLRQRELDENGAKKPKIASNVALLSDQKIPITTVPKILEKEKSFPNNEQTMFPKTITSVSTPSNKEINDHQIIANRVKDAIKIELIAKDSVTKHDYKLDSRVKFDHFY